MKKLHLNILFIGLLLTFSAGAQEAIVLLGSGTVQDRLIKPTSDLLLERTGINIQTNGVGTGKGLVMMLTGKSKYHVSMASSPLTTAISAATKAYGKELPDTSRLQIHVLGGDVILPIVHKDNPVESLTWEQLKDIHTGKITNWKEVGGDDMPVMVLTSHKGSATREIFQKQVMKKQPYIENAKVVSHTRFELNLTVQNKNAIGAVSQVFYDQFPEKEMIKIIKADPITRPLSFITNGDPEPEIQTLIDFYRSEEVQKML